MNQPASKEPTMDEILSSIRQIIADDDDQAASKNTAVAAKSVADKPAPEPEAVDAKPEPTPEPASPPQEDLIDPFSDDEDDTDADAPLALSPEQIVSDSEAEHAPQIDEDDALTPPEPENPAPESRAAVDDLVMPDDVAFEHDEDAVPDTKARSRVSEGAPMPDENLSGDLADELLEPATQAAVRNAFSKLDTPRLSADMPLGASGLTIEAMIREMLRPMLKDWLEENLPSMVERIVAQEIERASRGGR